MEWFKRLAWPTNPLEEDNPEFQASITNSKTRTAGVLVNCDDCGRPCQPGNRDENLCPECSNEREESSWGGELERG